MFNWLQQDLTSKTCLDLFAGTGSLSFEALSRNAKSSTILEKDKDIWSKLVQNKNSFNADSAKIINTSAELFLKKNQEKFDIIFFDPPFTKPFLYKLMINLHNHLKPHGLVYFESNNSYHGNEFKIFKSSRVGQVYFHLLIQN